MITGINESKTLKKHVSCKCECKFDSKKCNSNQIWNTDKCRCECKNPRKNVFKEGYIWNPAICTCENGRYAKSIIDDSVITCDEITEMTKTFQEKIFQQIFKKR